MNGATIIFTVFVVGLSCANANDVLGCGGFIKSHVPIDFSKVVVKLYTKQGILKDQTTCAPNNGYYFIPLYDKGDYVLQLQPPQGWSFTPSKFSVHIDGKTDVCSQQKDINFVFKGFGIAGKVQSHNSINGPAGVNVELETAGELRKTVTGAGGIFSFTPVYPGNYVIRISHPKWKLLKSTMSVTVEEGNTELPSNSLVINGYDVHGLIISDGEPISDASFVLFSESNDKNVRTEGCDTSPLPEFKSHKTPICHVTSNTRGEFVFPSISHGSYFIVPFYKGHIIQFDPPQIKFEVDHDSIRLNNNFEIVGFSISGKVLDSPNGLPLSSAAVLLDGRTVATTKADGTYQLLEKIKSGTYTLSALANDYKFEPKTLKVNPNLTQMPPMFPVAYKVVGNIISDQRNALEVTITRVGSTQHFNLKSDSKGQFSEYLEPGKYQVQVHGGSQNMQFYPESQIIEVTVKPLAGLTFSQLKATVSGKVACPDSDNLKVAMQPLDGADDFIIQSIVNGEYTFNDIKPGAYKVSLIPNNYCWKDAEFTVHISSETYAVPAFIQIGYAVTFISSHETKVHFKQPGQDAKETMLIAEGTSKHCLQKAGEYVLSTESCHVYPTNTIEYSTSQEMNEIQLTAKKHRTLVALNAAKDFGNVSVSVYVDGTKNLHGPLPYVNKRYILELFLGPGEYAHLQPESNTLYFNPERVSVYGENDCQDLGSKFEITQARLFQGKIVPPLEGVQIVIESENFLLMADSDSDGNYNFPPLDDAKQYSISAKKDSYVFEGPDDKGVFLAHKLAEIIVEVVHEADNAPLKGVLLSLSGGQSYRSNLQTNENGKITFSGLSPSEYFLRPMMKEYSFTPSSQIIKVQTGATMNILLKGKRVAYSASGQVTSLNSQAEERMVVVASGVNNCSEYLEEATSENNGAFKIRGLYPYCSYEMRIKNSMQEKDNIERSSPAIIKLSSITNDIEDLKIVVFRPPVTTDVLVRIYAENPEHYKIHSLKVVQESSPSGLVHSVKVDTSVYKISRDYNAGILVQIPSIPLDGKSYSIQLESSIPALNKGKPMIKFFTADNSFKFIQMDILVKANNIEQNIQQTSIVTLVFIFASMIAAYNAEKIAQVFKHNGAVVKSRMVPAINDSLWMDALRKGKTGNEFVSDNTDIDRIIESIEKKKKIKPKRI